jgi:hypothetical protein
MVEPDMEKVCEILQRGKIPIFEFKVSYPQEGVFTQLSTEA